MKTPSVKIYLPRETKVDFNSHSENMTSDYDKLNIYDKLGMNTTNLESGIFNSCHNAQKSTRSAYP